MNRRDTYTRAQALVEFAGIIVVLLIMVFGAIDFARMISLSNRIAAVARELGRMVYAMSYSEKPQDLAAIFGVATNMISPGDLNNNGQIIINYVQRVPGTNAMLSSTNNTNDVLIISSRFFYPPSGTNYTELAAQAPNWQSKLPAVRTNSSGKFIPFTNNELPVAVEMLKPYDRTSVVEVYHTNSMMTPLGALMNIPVFLYELAVF